MGKTAYLTPSTPCNKDRGSRSSYRTSRTKWGVRILDIFAYTCLHAMKNAPEAPMHRKKERVFFCEAGRPARGCRRQLARMEGVPECHVMDSMATGSRYKL